MPLPDNYNWQDYKTKDLYERLGFERRGSSVTPERVESAYRARMEYWQAMTHNEERGPHVAPAKNALAEARDVLSDPVKKAIYDSQATGGLGFKILLLGGPGAGKSALLGAIYDECMREKTLDPLKLTFSPKNRDNVLINLAKLKAFCKPEGSRSNGVLTRIANIRDTFTPYQMIVDLAGRDKIDLTFIDTSGEDLDAHSRGEGSLADHLKTSHAAILVVDTNALFHQQELQQNFGLPVNALRNMPENVESIVQDWIGDLPEAPRLLCIVPIKTESFSYDSKTGSEKRLAKSEIILEVCRVYTNTINYLEQQKNCVVVITPVQTCGNLILKESWRDELELPLTSYPSEQWDLLVNRARPSTLKPYSPSDCHLPLVYILNFFLCLAEKAEKPAFEIPSINIPDRYMALVNKFLGEESGGAFLEILGAFRSAAQTIILLMGLPPRFKEAIKMIMERSERGGGEVKLLGNTSLLTH